MEVNNGKYRRTEIEFKKFVNGAPVFTGGFPISLSILNAFAEYPTLTEQQFTLLSDVAYNTRLNAFYQYLALTYPFFSLGVHIPNPQDELVNSNGNDVASCPIDLTPVFSNYIRLSVEYFELSDGIREAVVKAIAVNGAGDLVIAPIDIPFTYILKEFSDGQITDWDLIEGSLLNGFIPMGQSEAVLVSRFRYRGVDAETLPYKSVYVSLYELPEDIEFRFSEPKTISITMNLPAYLLNFISNLNSSYQDRITGLQASDIVSSANGMVNKGKNDFHFVFDANVRQRPVLMYPQSWGNLSEVNFPQGGNINIIYDGAFQLDGTEPYVLPLIIDGASINYLVYSAANLIIYPYKVDYHYKF